VALLRSLATRLAPGSRVVFTCMTADRQGRLGFPAGHPLIDRWLRHQREVFRWGIAPEHLPSFLARVGLRLVAHDEAEALARRFLPPGDRRRGAHGEAVLVTEPVHDGSA
jgi:O-methyltransferase involved in polyketide biosynthesis